jgi:hypothetical protein
MRRRVALHAESLQEIVEQVENQGTEVGALKVIY